MTRVKGDRVPCVYKWGWSTIMLQSNYTSSCHRVQNEPIPKKFKNFHNTPLKIQDRLKMLRGEWPGRGCEYCRDIESAGGISDRQDQLEMNHYDEMVPKQSFDNPNSVKVSPKMVEVYFSNLCNMSCIYCGPKFSHKWYHEVKNNPNDPSLDVQRWEASVIDSAKIDLVAVTNKFFKWLKTEYKTLYNLRILGGEPFFQPETDRMLDFIETETNPNITISIFSNLKVNHSRFINYIDRLNTLHESNQVRQINVVCSIDCWGPPAEYTRQGLICEDWEKNFKYLIANSSINTQIHGTMNSLSIHTMKDLISLRNHYSRTYNRPIGYDNNILVDPYVLRPDLWPKGTFTDAFDQACDLLTGSELNILKGYQLRIESATVDPNIEGQLIAWLELADARRGTDWRRVFPWLAELESAKR